MSSPKCLYICLCLLVCLSACFVLLVSSDIHKEKLRFFAVKQDKSRLPSSSCPTTNRHTKQTTNCDLDMRQKCCLFQSRAPLPAKFCLPVCISCLLNRNECFFILFFFFFILFSPTNKVCLCS